MPLELELTSQDSILVVDPIGKRVLEVDCSHGDQCSQPEVFAAIPEFERPVTVARDGLGMTWVGDYDAQTLFIFDAEGKLEPKLESFAGFSD